MVQLHKLFGIGLFKNIYIRTNIQIIKITRKYCIHFQFPVSRFFNWTMTTRWDSDIVHPYGWIEPVNASLVPLHPTPEQVRLLMTANNLTNYATIGNKTKMAAWFSSRCNLTTLTSGREIVVEKLMEHGISVDVYGSCGNLTCGNRFDNKTDEQDEGCRKMAAENYKFYLAFENSLCLDYVTEKYIL